MTDAPYTARTSRARLLRFLVPVLVLHGVLLATLPYWQGQPPAGQPGVAVRLAPIAAPTAPQPAVATQPVAQAAMPQPTPATNRPDATPSTVEAPATPAVARKTAPPQRPTPRPATAPPRETQQAEPIRQAAAAPTVPDAAPLQDVPGDAAAHTRADNWRSLYRSELRIALARYLRYPARARRFGLSGEVVVGFTIERDGRFAHIHLAHSSDAALLDQAALDTVRRLGHFRPLPVAYSEDSWEVEVPLVYRLD